MLVLTRKIDEEVLILLGERKVVVRVLRVECGRVRLGITADRSVPIHRAELMQAETPPGAQVGPSAHQLHIE